MENAIFARGIQAFQEELAEHGYNLLIASSSYCEDTEAGQIRNTLPQLTRDLAERMKREIHGSGRWPELLRDVVCLRMNPKCFGGGLRYEWHV